jgi:hypothetical protein
VSPGLGELDKEVVKMLPNSGQRCEFLFSPLIRTSLLIEIDNTQISICSCPDKDESFDSSNGGILVQAFCTKMREKAVINSRKGIKANVLIEDLRFAFVCSNAVSWV